MENIRVGWLHGVHRHRAAKRLARDRSNDEDFGNFRVRNSRRYGRRCEDPASAGALR